MKTVHVVGGFDSYISMFENHGWTSVELIEDADLVQFCGGRDIWPGFYGQKKHPLTNLDLERDRYEKAMLNLSLRMGCAIAGICRGAQFVHAMNGGSLYQHVDRHDIGASHTAFIQVPKLKYMAPHGLLVSSTHHQMMKPDKGLVVLGCKMSTQKQGEREYSIKSNSAYDIDVEAVYHEKTNSLCYQPHPEHHSKTSDCQIFYFKLIKHLLKVVDKKEKEE